MADTMELDPAYLAETLRLIRETQKLTQENVAELCNVSTRTVEKIESGRHRPDEQTLRSLARGLGYDITVFFKPSPAEEARFREDLARAVRKTVHVPTTIAKTTKDFLAFMSCSHATRADYREVEEGEALEEALAFIENVRDWGDLWEEIGIGGQLDGAKGLANGAARLQELGYSVHVGRHRQMQRYKEGPPLIFDVALVIIRSMQTSATQEYALVELGDGWEALPEDRVKVPEEWTK